MIGLRHRTLAVGGAEFLTVGPLFSGLVLRGVWWNITTLLLGEVQWGLSIQNTGEESFEAFVGGRSLIERSDVVVTAIGLPAVRMRLNAAFSTTLTVPVYVPVHDGPVWVGMGLLLEGGGHAQLGAIVEPERLVRPSIDRGPAARLGGANGEVLERLRLEALAAVG